MATFGKCRSRRELFASDQNPGPGAYEGNEHSSLLASMHTFTQADSRTAMFRSGTLLAHQMVRSLTISSTQLLTNFRNRVLKNMKSVQVRQNIAILHDMKKT